MTGELNQWIWDTMLSMTLLMLLVLMIRKPVSHFFGARIAYLLWALPLARLFMPTLTLEAPAAAPALTEPVAGLVPVNLGSELVATAPAQTSAMAALASLDWVMIATILWLGGAGLLFISKLASYLQFREDIVADGQLIGRHGNIKILETAAVGGPLAFGLFEKYIAVPTNFFRDYAPRERELALEHEIAHHESGDLAANFVGLTVLSLHWFNPVAWFAWIAFRQDQETACDARVLTQRGSDMRAVYGRTIAKSMSGHRLGLASPLNQKNKIKGRLKMLGQSEKSSLRRKLGAGLVAAGTVVALPLTATVTYAEAVEPLDISEPLTPAIPAAPLAPAAPVPPAAPVAPIAPAADDKTVNITMLDGRENADLSKGYVHKIKHEGRTVILRTDKKLSDKEIRKMVAEAEKSRLKAEKALLQEKQSLTSGQEWRIKAEESRRKAELSRLQADVSRAEAEEWRIKANNVRRETDIKRELAATEKEMKQALQEAEQEMREALHEAAIERREAMEKAREARQEALQQVAPVARLSSIFYFQGSSRSTSRSGKAKGPDCIAMNKEIAMGGPNGLATQAWAVVAGCGGFEVKVDKAAILDAALQGLKKERAEAVKCKDDKVQRARKIEEIDRSIEQVKAQMVMI